MSTREKSLALAVGILMAGVAVWHHQAAEHRVVDDTIALNHWEPGDAVHDQTTKVVDVTTVTRIAFLNTAQLFFSWPEAKDVNATVRTDQQAFETKYRAARDALQAQRDRLELTGLNPDQRKAKLEPINKQAKDLDGWATVEVNRIQANEKELRVALARKVDAAVRQVVQAQHVDAVLATSLNIYLAPQADLTGAVLEQLSPGATLQELPVVVKDAEATD